MQFISQLFTSNVKRLEKNADDILPISDNLRALRVDGEIHIVDDDKNKVIKKFDDKFPSNPARAVMQIQKKLKLNDKEASSSSEKTWTCGYRDGEKRWVWYQDNRPKMTVAFNEAYSSAPEYLSEFSNARYGNAVIGEIKKDGLETVASKINASVLKNSFIEVECKLCNSTDKYTIDDLVDTNKVAKYDSNNVVCSNCNDLIQL